MKPMKREDVTDLIVVPQDQDRASSGPTSPARSAQSKEWTTAACLGQMQMTKKQAETVGKIFDLPEEAVLILQTVPYKGSLPTAVPTDPLIYRWYEIVNVYGTTIKELIHEEFGDGIMSAIDFSMDIKPQSRTRRATACSGDVGEIPAVQDLLRRRPAAGARALKASATPTTHIAPVAMKPHLNAPAASFTTPSA